MISKEEFIEKLKDPAISDREIVQGYITHGSTFVFDGDDNKYFKLKKIIADYFHLHPEEIIMVGSAKLGFSIAQTKLWKPFNDESDIDMVIISGDVFDSFWKELYDFNVNLTDRTTEEQEQYDQFRNYFFRGWIRPDLFPFSYDKKDSWFDFFRSISYREFGKWKITGAIFHDLYFYESYHALNVKKIRDGGLING